MPRASSRLDMLYELIEASESWDSTRIGPEKHERASTRAVPSTTMTGQILGPLDRSIDSNT